MSDPDATMGSVRSSSSDAGVPMPLRIFQTRDVRPACGRLQGALRSALAEGGRAEVLAPTFGQALEVQKALAEADGLSLGVGVTTPRAWVAERWQAYGDGTRLVADDERLALAGIVLEAAQKGSDPVPPATAGSVDALAGFASRTMAWLPLANDGWVREADPRIAGLSLQERAFVSLAGALRLEMRARGLMEPCEAAAALPALLAEAGVEPVPIMATGFTGMPYATRMLLVGLARTREADVFVPLPEGPAGRLSATLVSRLAMDAFDQGMDCEVADADEGMPAAGGPACEPARRVGELDALCSALFRVGEPGVAPVVPTGAVRMLEPAGPLAEAELVAQALCELPDEAREAVVCVPDTGRAFAELAPKLAARGMLVRGMRKRSVLSLGTARSFMGYAGLLARLAELPWPEAGEDGVCPLGDMSWWPPHEATDFLLSEASGVPREQAWKLDAEFRGNRVLSPAEVLARLSREKATSRGCARATGAILGGRLDTAAFQLIRAAKDEGRALPADVETALLGIARAAQTLVRLGIRAECDPAGERAQGSGRVGAAAPQRRVPLSKLVGLVLDLLRQQTAGERVELGPEDAPRTVRICGRGEAATLPACSADAVVACGLTLAESPLTPDEGAVTRLEEALGLASSTDPLDRERQRFAALAAVPRSSLMLERTLRDADAKPSYPAMALAEALSCYGFEPREERTPAEKAYPGMPAATRSEAPVAENASAAGVAQRVITRVPPVPTGLISDASRRMVVVPREGEEELEGGVPSLSASQIESYLECPFKWFTLRRLGLRSVDAEFSAMEMGSFAHHVLEVTYSRLLEEAARAQGLLAPDAPFDQLALPALYVPNTSPSEFEAAYADGDVYASDLLDEVFDAHREEQLAHARKRAAQSLVPHSKKEEWELGQLRRSLWGVLDYDAKVLRGFEPRFFELRFGGGANETHATYAGVDLVGSIDRVDVAPDGTAVIVDYKHKSPFGFADEYDVFGKEGCADAASFELPRRVQSLIYAQVLRRLMPELHVIGAVYLSTRENARHQHALAGVVEGAAATKVLSPEDASEPRLARFEAGHGNIGLDEVLDLTEERIASALGRLREGRIEADPKDARACSYCPVHLCERRLT